MHEISLINVKTLWKRQFWGHVSSVYNEKNMFHPQAAAAAWEVKKPRIIAAMIRPTDSTAAGINECIFSRKSWWAACEPTGIKQDSCIDWKRISSRTVGSGGERPSGSRWSLRFQRQNEFRSIGDSAGDSSSSPSVSSSSRLPHFYTHPWVFTNRGRRQSVWKRRFFSNRYGVRLRTLSDYNITWRSVCCPFVWWLRKSTPHVEDGGLTVGWRLRFIGSLIKDWLLRKCITPNASSACRSRFFRFDFKKSAPHLKRTVCHLGCR